MSEKDRVLLTPGACFDHDLENYYIEVELPGVDKEHIEVTVSPPARPPICSCFAHSI